MRALFALLIALGGAPPILAADGHAPSLAESVKAFTKAPLALQGGGVLRYFGLAIYRGYYWSSTPGWSLDHPFALDIVYERDLDGQKIAERSVEEMVHIGQGSAVQHAQWGHRMKQIFPNVGQGDRLTGAFAPPASTAFFHNGKPIGEVNDKAFARAFFGIWLDPETSRPELRRQLLGER